MIPFSSVYFSVLCLCFSVSVFASLLLPLPSVSAADPLVQNWFVPWGGASNDYRYRHCVDGSGSGSIYVVATAHGAGIGAATSAFQANSAGLGDMAILKYNSAGVQQWMRLIQNNLDQSVLSCVSDVTGALYIIGHSPGQLINSLGTFENSGTDQDVLVAKYDTTGALIWFQYGSISTTAGFAAVDDWPYQIMQKDNYLWVVSTAASFSGFVLTKLDVADGKIIWQQKWQSISGTVNVNQATIDANNLIYITGHTDGSVASIVNQNGATIPGWTVNGGWDGFLVLFDAVSGSRLANVPQQSSNWDMTTGVVVDGSGLVYVGGHSRASMNGQPFTGIDYKTWLLAYSLPKLELQWTRQYGANSGFGHYLFADGLGGIYQTQFFKTPYNDNYRAYPSWWGNDLVSFLEQYAEYAPNGGSYTVTPPTSYRINKFDMNGNFLYSIDHNAIMNTISLDQSGTLIVSGTFSGTLNGFAAQGPYDGFLRKLTFNFNCSCTDLSALVADVQNLLNIAPAV